MSEDAQPQPGPKEQRINVWLRLRPVPRPSGQVASSPQEGWVEFNVPRDASQGLVNNSRESYRFPFDGLLPPDAQQDEVFDRVALPVLRSALDGFNGTIFAYGQTGSGKTFTVMGGGERYADRGLIPRAISALFAEAAARPDQAFAVHVSFLEIHCEAGYDLLEPSRGVQALEDLPRVHVMEDDDGRMHLRNLSLHRCEGEEQALNMLFLGNTNCVVAETPLNPASSRSHCLFTLHIEARRPGEAVVRRSKLHFVDLAGSERVGKTGLSAQAQLREAKHINLGLHFLEQVIISLQEGRAHVPYRNSMLTQVLRDSLGGNSRTVMVAAVAPEAQHLEESIATCRFAQRVAMLATRVEVNEEVDLEMLLLRLKQENALLRQELQLLRSTPSASASDVAGGQGEVAAGAGPQQWPALSEGERHALRRQVQAFVDDPAADALLEVQPSMLFIQAAFAMLKGLARGLPLSQQVHGSTSASQGPASTAEEMCSLWLLAQQQEQQIGVLAGVLRKQGHRSTMQQPAVAAPPSSRPSSSGSGHTSSQGSRHAGEVAAGQQGGAAPGWPYSDGLLADQHKAFEYFCTASPAHDAVADHKAVLRGKHEEARTLATQVSSGKQRIGELKAGLERRRLARAMAAMLQQQAGGGDAEGEGQQDAEEERVKQSIDKEKAVYLEAYTALRGIKVEVEGVQALLEQARARLQRDFKAWYAAMAASSGSMATGTQQQAGLPASGAGKQSFLPDAQQSNQQAPRQVHQQAPWQLEKQALGDAQQNWPLTAAGTLAHCGSSGNMAAGEEQPQAGMAFSATPSFSSWKAVPSLSLDQQPKGSHAPPGPASDCSSAATASQPASQQAAAAPWKQQAGQAAQLALPQQQSKDAAGQNAFAGVEPAVLAVAQPLLTGQPQADADIIQFYQARHALLQGIR